MKKLIKSFILGLVLSLFFGMSVAGSGPTPYNIRPGACDESWKSFVLFYEDGSMSREEIQYVINSGGFSADIAEKLVDELNRIDGAATEPQEKTPQTKPEAPVEKHTHKYNPEEIQQATCQKKGIVKYSCSCGDSYTEEIDITDHLIGEAVLTKAATCSEEGEMRSKCVWCNEEFIDIIPKFEHEAGEPEVSVEATCTNPGGKIVRCRLCGEVIGKEEIPPTSHTPGAMTIEKKAGFFKNGAETVRCTECDTLILSKVIPYNQGLSWGIVAVVGLGLVVVAVLIIGKRRKANAKK